MKPTVLKVKTSGSYSEVNIEGASRQKVDWGDGTISEGDSYNGTHSYYTDDEYIITIGSLQETLMVKGAGLDSVELLQWGENLTSVNSCFYDLGGTFKGTIPKWGDKITSAYKCFANTAVSGKIPQWNDVMKVTDACYGNCRALTGDVPAWNSSITSTDYTYADCIGLTGNIPKWGESIISVVGTYCGCRGLTGAWTDDPNELMPTRLASDHYYNAVYDCVKDTSESLQSLFYPEWGGTKPNEYI